MPCLDTWSAQPATLSRHQSQSHLSSVAPTEAQRLLSASRRSLAGGAPRPCVWARSVLSLSKKPACRDHVTPCWRSPFLESPFLLCPDFRYGCHENQQHDVSARCSPTKMSSRPRPLYPTGPGVHRTESPSFWARGSHLAIPLRVASREPRLAQLRKPVLCPPCSWLSRLVALVCQVLMLRFRRCLSPLGKHTGKGEGCWLLESNGLCSGPSRVAGGGDNPL